MQASTSSIVVALMGLFAALMYANSMKLSIATIGKAQFGESSPIQKAKIF
jgi:hypothetical protein